jgi:sugar-specific transcriptional regulator TrmB
MIKAITYQIVITMIKEIFSLVLPRLSSHIRELLRVYIKDLYDKAKSTENIFDDFAVELIADILQIDLSSNQNKQNEGAQD